MNSPRTDPTPQLLHAPLMADGTGAVHTPGALVLEGGRVTAFGTPQSVGQVAGARARRLDQHAVIPALVNAHAHLDLTELGCWPFGGDFEAWLGKILAARGGQTQQSVDASVQQGVTASHAGGVAAVGDICGPWAADACLRHLRSQGLSGVAFAEVFGMGAKRAATLQEVQRLVGVSAGGAASPPVLGIQPHAPYSSDRSVFLAVLKSGVRASTHLAESPEELEFLSKGTGKFRSFLERLGGWDGSAAIGARHAVDWLVDVLAAAPGSRVLCAHLNYVDDAALALLARAPIDVAYCPRSSAYFGHVNHRYRDMLRAGVRVALGTDSIVCLDTPDRISTLDEVRFLMRRDGVELSTALAMATVNGAIALGLPADAFTLQPGVQPKAGVLAVPMPVDAGAVGRDAANAFARSNAAPQWISGPFGPSAGERAADINSQEVLPLDGARR